MAQFEGVVRSLSEPEGLVPAGEGLGLGLGTADGVEDESKEAPAPPETTTSERSELTTDELLDEKVDLLEFCSERVTTPIEENPVIYTATHLKIHFSSQC